MHGNEFLHHALNAEADAVRFDEYGNIRFNDEKARLDNFAIQLQNEPGARRRRLSSTVAALVRAKPEATALKTISSIRAESKLDVSQSSTVDAVQT